MLRRATVMSVPPSAVVSVNFLVPGLEDLALACATPATPSPPATINLPDLASSVAVWNARAASSDCRPAKIIGQRKGVGEGIE